MKRALSVAVLVVALAALSVYVLRSRESPRDQNADSPPNVVLVEICSLRYDHLGCTGYDRPTSPTMDGLARRGLLFRRCISQASWTKPSTASILTGLTSNVHQLTDYYEREQIVGEDFGPKRVLSPDVTTLAEALKGGRGYQTGAFVANVHAWPAFGFDQGFDHFDCEDPLDGFSLVGRFEEWLNRRDPAEPFFAFFLFKDVHHPYWPPYSYYKQFTRDASPVAKPDYADYCRSLNELFLPQPKDLDAITSEDLRRWMDLYDGQVRAVDDALSRLLAALNERDLADNTAILVVSDHGDHHLEHGKTNHGGTLYQDLIHVPMIAAFPGATQPHIVDDVVRCTDIFSTVCEYCGIPVNHPVQGASLMPYVAGPNYSSSRPRYAFSSIFGDRHSIQGSRWKLTRWFDGTEQLFDLLADPGENNDVSADRPEVLRQLRRKLDSVLAQEKELRSSLRGPAVRELDEDTVKQLKSLGYL